jgi:hypothetical protein
MLVTIAPAGDRQHPATNTRGHVVTTDWRWTLSASVFVAMH